MKTKLYRHGEIIFERVKSAPLKGMKPATTNVLATGKHGHAHTFKGGEMFLKDVDQFVFGYFKAKDTKLFHAEHSPDGAVLPDGVYILRRQSEYTPEGMKIIV